MPPLRLPVRSLLFAVVISGVARESSGEGERVGGWVTDSAMAQATPAGGFSDGGTGAHCGQDFEDVMTSNAELGPHGLPAAEYHGMEPPAPSIRTGNMQGTQGEETQASLNSPAVAGDAGFMGLAFSTLEMVRNWSLNTYKCTRQMVTEQLGRGSRTLDPELSARVVALTETRRRYRALLRVARSMLAHFQLVVTAQRNLADCFSELGHKSPDLQEEFSYNAETQRLLCKNGETLLRALTFFVNSINTLTNKTMADTLMTVRHYEAARLQFDAYRADVELLRNSATDPASAQRLDVAQKHFLSHKDKFERLREDVAIKLKFLDENKVKVMQKQLLLFHNATSAYFAGNQQQLELTLKQFNVNSSIAAPTAGIATWVEGQ
ncbi:arfaptin-2 isoform X1 [Petromyzon marinus]|uniref:Arfaptin-2 isoform X1 n=2 Tax=Petromyzon marinus TaxID=7757 RepID=A0AAJ7T6P7_PETMA|nr:arfaptin-2 isoform X1 [Petromyzon marinus]